MKVWGMAMASRFRVGFFSASFRGVLLINPAGPEISLVLHSVTAIYVYEMHACCRTYCV